MLLVGVATIPRGGMITVDPVEGSSGFRISASGVNVRLTPATTELLVGSSSQPVDAHGIQPFYTGILARDCGLTIGGVVEGETAVVTAT
jgi:histidine phosphotransferase ChpT